jgi:hypothetical protein
MPGLVPGIHVLLTFFAAKTWMAGTSPAMTMKTHCEDGGHGAKSAPLPTLRRYLHGLESLTSNFPSAPEMTKSL